MRNGVLVGYVPAIDGSDDYTEEQIIDAIVRTDYDKPIASGAPPRPRPRRPCPARAACSDGSWTASATTDIVPPWPFSSPLTWPRRRRCCTRSSTSCPGS